MVHNMGRFWSAHEIRSMLMILINNNFGPLLFVAGAHQNEHAFVRAAEELSLLGYNRVSRQCRSKFKLLRQQFNSALLNFGPNPAPQNQSPFWAELKILWQQANRPHPGHAFPVDVAPGVDTMHLGVRRQELQEIIAVIQDLAQRGGYWNLHPSQAKF
ncbi:hypothetical protein JRQ81_010973 [Phrynocephalus forsythii]|uniref:Myb/SANT-like DNA-binding domain-containing protein n=1 Tax=Phrynocephalus forsythii TaxID=171643 RepID=A0A9Q1AR88_9SAUR|nr:hypothetical protein JRQ81_010973 [Phrynocephalus forsythii]